MPNYIVKCSLHWPLGNIPSKLSLVSEEQIFTPNVLFPVLKYNTSSQGYVAFSITHLFFSWRMLWPRNLCSSNIWESIMATNIYCSNPGDPREPSKVRHFVPLWFQLYIGCSSLVKDSSLVKNSPFTKTWTNWTSFNCTDLGLSANWVRSAITSRITGATDSNRQFGTCWQHQSRILE